MSPTRKRLLRIAAVAAAQLASVWAAVALLSVVMETGSRSAGNLRTQSSLSFIILGYPAAWQVERQEGRWERPWPTDRRSATEPAGWNPVVPAAMLIAAVCLPPAVLAAFARSYRSRRTRVMAVGLLAGAVAIAAATVEEETGRHGVTTFVARPPGKWARGTQNYHQVREYGGEARHWADRHLPAAIVGHDWPARTRLTLLAWVTAAGVGCALLKPWRRRGGESAPPAG